MKTQVAIIGAGLAGLSAAITLQDAGCEVLGVVAIFDYGFEAAKANFAAAGVPYYTLSNYEYLLPIALEQGFIEMNQLGLLEEWRKAPDAWGK